MKNKLQTRLAHVLILSSLRDYARARRRNARFAGDACLYSLSYSSRASGQISIAKLCGLISDAQAARFNGLEEKITKAAITRIKLKAVA